MRAFKNFMSPPAENARPAPVRTTARTLSSALSVSMTSLNFSPMSTVSALSNFGRFKVMVTTPVAWPLSATSRVTVTASPSDAAEYWRRDRGTCNAAWKAGTALRDGVWSAMAREMPSLNMVCLFGSD